MALRNTLESYGAVARTFHWLTALLILTAIPLGLVANRMPYDTAAALANKAQLFSLHKTLGVSAFIVAVLRLAWTVTQPQPAAVRPDRRIETALAGLVHWTLYLSLILVPLSGWVHHAATTGFAPILWPFGQTLPFVPRSEAVAALAGSLHWAFTKLLIGAVLLHVAGALKHHLIDRDATLRRMVSGQHVPVAAAGVSGRGPLVAALTLYALGTGLAVAMSRPETGGSVAPLAAVASEWQVKDGTLDIAVKQMGQDVRGSFAEWTAVIAFDPTPAGGRNGSVTATIATGSLTLGSVTAQAKAEGFFDTVQFPTAVFTATIVPDGTDYRAEGTLSLKGMTAPVTLPFRLTMEGGTAIVEGSTTIDRRSFSIGTAYPDEASVGFAATVTLKLRAERGSLTE